jgi:hypothetical protein
MNISESHGGIRRLSVCLAIFELILPVVLIGACSSDDGGVPDVVQYEVTVTCLDDQGTYANQTFTATFEIDVARLAGVGSETLTSAINNFSFDFPRGLSSGSGLGTAYFENGVLTKIELASGGAYGFNIGFASGQVPDAIESGLWFGYLHPSTLLDGFGTYTITRL